MNSQRNLDLEHLTAHISHLENNYRMKDQVRQEEWERAKGPLLGDFLSFKGLFQIYQQQYLPTSPW